MIDAGLLPGDKVVVERRHTAADGDIVVAIVDNESTIKRLVKEHGRFILKPENKAYPILRPKELEIFGVVVGRDHPQRQDAMSALAELLSHPAIWRGSALGNVVDAERADGIPRARRGAPGRRLAGRGADRDPAAARGDRRIAHPRSRAREPVGARALAGVDRAALPAVCAGPASRGHRPCAAHSWSGPARRAKPCGPSSRPCARTPAAPCSPGRRKSPGPSCAACSSPPQERRRSPSCSARRAPPAKLRPPRCASPSIPAKAISRCAS